MGKNDMLFLNMLFESVTSVYPFVLLFMKRYYRIEHTEKRVITDQKRSVITRILLLLSAVQ